MEQKVKKELYEEFRRWREYGETRITRLVDDDEDVVVEGGDFGGTGTGN